MKKIYASILTLAIALAITVPVYADDPYQGYDTDTRDENSAGSGTGTGAGDSSGNTYTFLTGYDQRDDGHKQNLYIDVNEGATAGDSTLTKIYMQTEGNPAGDYQHTTPVYYHTQSMTFTVYNSNGVRSVVTLNAVQKTGEVDSSGRAITYYELSPPRGGDVDSYIKETYGEDVRQSLICAMTGQTKQTWGTNADYARSPIVECNGNLALTVDDGKTWSSYTITNQNGSLQQVAAQSLLNQKMNTSTYGKMSVQSAINLRESHIAEISQLNALKDSGKASPEQLDRLESISSTLNELTTAINQARPQGITGENWLNLVNAAADPSSATSQMFKNMEKAWQLSGMEGKLEDFDGILCDANIKYGVKLLEMYGFRKPSDIINHIDWIFQGSKTDKKTVINKTLDELYPGMPDSEKQKIKKQLEKEEQENNKDPEEPSENSSDGPFDIVHEPYNPTGSITLSKTDVRDDGHQHRIGGDGNIFDLGEPLAWTYNDSVEYDDASGHHVGFSDEPGDRDGNSNGIIIPSSEKYLNGITVNTSNGKASLGLGCMQATYTGKYSYQLQQMINAWDEVDVYMVNGNEVSESTYENAKEADDVGSEGVELDHFTRIEQTVIDGCLWACDWNSHPGATAVTQRYLYYLYLEDLNVTDFDAMTTYNDTFTIDTETYNASTDLHVYRDIPVGEVRVNSIGGSVQGRPTTYHVEEGYTDGEINITSTAADSAAGFRTSTFEPKGEYHLVNWAQPTDEGYKNWDLGVFTVWQTAAKEAPYLHYWGGSVTTSPPGSGEAMSAAQERLEWNVGDMKNVSTKTAGGEIWNLAEYKTGKLTMPGAGGASQEIMGGQTGLVTHKGGDDAWTSSFAGTTVPSYLRPVMSAIMGAGSAYQGAKESMIESYESTPALGKEQQRIPDEQANGEYPTSIQNVTYKQVLVSKAMGGKTTTGMGIKPAYNGNEPIIIQTPVVSPVSVWLDNGAETGSSPLREYSPGEGENQLVTEDDSVRQFRLDESYWFKFDPLQHLITQGYEDINGIPFDNTWRDDNIKFDKYTEAKYVHFPFDVCIYEGGTNGDLDHPVITNETPTYHPHVTDESDPNYWIKIYDRNDSGTLDNIEWNKFYIPSWAHEDAYTSGDVIKYKVEAINVMNAGGDAEEEEKNEYGDPKRPNKEKYIATYTIKCQVSGWLYNFQVVGSNLRDMYDRDLTTEAETKWHDLYYAYCFDREEKKAGVWNRLANDFEDRYGWVSKYLRYTVDGTATNSWNEKDTIIIAAHNSHRLNNPGVAPAGTQFAYSFQSMANLWNKNDWIEIRPTFKYIKDGTTYTTDPNSGTNMETSGTPQSLHVYYDDYETGNEVKRLVEYGSTTDSSNWHSVTLADEMFLGSYLKEDSDRSARYPEPDYANGDIRGFHDTVTGAQESLTNAFLNKKVNETYTLKDIKLKSGLRIFSGDECELKVGLKRDRNTIPQVTTLYNGATGTQPLMDHAVQTWYGEYWLPSDLYITTKTRDELEDYANKHGGLQPDDPVFMHDGLLIVHFDIIAHNSVDPDQDLKYSGGNGGSHGFKNEKAGDPGDGDDYYDVTVGDPPSTISVQYGDVIIIDPDKKIEDQFKAAYWTIN